MRHHNPLRQRARDRSLTYVSGWDWLDMDRRQSMPFPITQRAEEPTVDEARASGDLIKKPRQLTRLF